MGRLAAVPMLAVVLATAGISVAAAAPATPTLSPRRVIACQDFAAEPVDLEWHAGRIWLLDTMERVIWRIARDGAGRDALEVGGTRPRDLFFGCGGVIHVVDPWDRVVRRGTPNGKWTARHTGHRVFHGDGDEAGIVLTGPRAGERPLADVITCAGDTLRCGHAFQVPHPFASVTANANYIQVALADSLVVIAHRALGYLRVHARDGRHLADFRLPEPELASVRSWYLDTIGDAPAGPVSTAGDTLLDDLLRAAEPGTFPVPVYVSDLVVHDGRIHVVCDSTLLIHDRHGALVARYAFAGRHRGERVIVHQICFAADGSLLGLDVAHYHKIYDFGPLPPVAATP